MNTLAPESVRNLPESTADKPSENTAETAMMHARVDAGQGRGQEPGDCGTDFYSARDIARATGMHKKYVHRKALREGWPTRPNGNRFEYQPPPAIARLVIATPSADR